MSGISVNNETVHFKGELIHPVDLENALKTANVGDYFYLVWDDLFVVFDGVRTRVMCHARQNYVDYADYMAAKTLFETGNEGFAWLTFSLLAKIRPQTKYHKTAFLKSAYGITAASTGTSITNVIFNDPATIVMWSDGTKTVVKRGENDVYDPEKGMAMAIAKKFLGTSESKGDYYEAFKKWIPKKTAEQEELDVLHQPVILTMEEVCALLHGDIRVSNVIADRIGYPSPSLTVCKHPDDTIEIEERAIHGE